MIEFILIKLQIEDFSKLSTSISTTVKFCKICIPNGILSANRSANFLNILYFSFHYNCQDCFINCHVSNVKWAWNYYLKSLSYSFSKCTLACTEYKALFECFHKTYFGISYAYQVNTQIFWCEISSLWNVRCECFAADMKFLWMKHREYIGLRKLLTRVGMVIVITMVFWGL